MSTDRLDFLQAADRIGHRLCRDALWSEGRCTWLGWAMEAHGGAWRTAYRPASAVLYEGSAGIGLFLARLFRFTGEPILRDTACAALAHALSGADALASGGDYGLHAGLGGIALACSAAGRQLEREALAAHGDAVLRRAARIAPDRDRVDVINGSAGLIPLLLAASHGERGEELLRAAIAHGEHLLALAARTTSGWSWNTLGSGAPPGAAHLLGYAHGGSGIACALAALGAASGRAAFTEAALAALAYERAHFQPDQGNWPDLRDFVPRGTDGRPACMLAWCHGAPGIGLARLFLHRLLPDEPWILAEAETAIRTTAASLGGTMATSGSFCLCHGDGGNADLLIEASRVLDRPALLAQARAAGAAAVARYEDGSLPWPCGLPGAGETPGLMLGLAGIGHALLRLHDPEQVPSVLICATDPRWPR